MQNATQLLKIRRATSLMVGAAGMALLAGSPYCAFAQNKPAASDETVVIVTAQKREQKLQDVPIVVTTLSAKLLQDAGVHDIKDMQILTPGLSVSSTSNESLTTIRIRGVGTVGDNPGLESSVGVVIDGVYRPRNGVGFEDLGELERIEVLKGPQGTLFGKNTSAGVVNIITQKPSFTYGANAEATFGNFGAQGYSASLTGPIIADKLAGRLYLAHRQRDGFYNVDTAGGPRALTTDSDQKFDTARGQLLFVPNDSSTIRVIADYTKRDENCCVAVQTHTGPTAPILAALSGGHGVMTTPDPTARTAFANRGTGQIITDQGVSIEGNFKLPNFLNSELTSITAVRDWKSINAQDVDYSGADILYRNGTGGESARFKTFSQELRLAGETDHTNWMVGGFYTDETLDHHDQILYGASYEPYIGLLLSNGADPTFVSKLTGMAYGTNYVAGQGSSDVYKQKDQSYALFTNESWRPAEKVEITLGLRYTHEAKTMTANYANTDGGAACGAALTKYGTAAALLQAYGTPAAAVAHGASPYWVGALANGSATQAAGVLCLTWANPYYNGLNLHQTQSAGNTSGTLKAAYHFSPDVMGYVSYARGYKAGGFNLDRVQSGITPNTDMSFAAETVDSYEAGLKSNLLNNSLTLDVAAFEQTFSNFQLNTFVGTEFVVESIPSLKSTGVDADIYWRTPVPGLSVQGGVTYADTRYGNFTASDLKTSANFVELSLLPGAQASLAPKWSSSLAVTWGGNLGKLRASANLTAKYTSEYNTGSDLIPYKEQNAFTMVNGRVTLGSQNKSWAVDLWAQNLTNVTYKQVVFNGPIQGVAFQSTVQPGGSYYNKALDSTTYDAFLGAPRTYGVTLRVKY